MVVKRFDEVKIGDKLPFGREVIDKISLLDKNRAGYGEVTIVLDNGAEVYGQLNTTLTVLGR